MISRLRHHRSTIDATTSTHTNVIPKSIMPIAWAPRKSGHSDRPAITLSEQQQENIR
ncbi:unnamed protein product, partial [Rotaria sp. Silwood1]